MAKNTKVVVSRRKGHTLAPKVTKKHSLAAINRRLASDPERLLRLAERNAAKLIGRSRF